jgi:hypothetical protein
VAARVGISNFSFIREVWVPGVALFVKVCKFSGLQILSKTSSILQEYAYLARLYLSCKEVNYLPILTGVGYLNC